MITYYDEKIRIRSECRSRDEVIELDESLGIWSKVDDDKSIITGLDVSRAHSPGEEARHINVDFPAWMFVPLDREARRLGVTRQSIIKMWIAERLQQGG